MLPITLRHTSADGLWRLRFAGTQIVLPLRRESFWLDWGFALGVLGHDAEVKRTYEMLLLSDRPDLFIDIGANYGTHSMLMAAAGHPGKNGLKNSHATINAPPAAKRPDQQIALRCCGRYGRYLPQFSQHAFGNRDAPVVAWKS
jgi:hypothetical protein